MKKVLVVLITTLIVANIQAQVIYDFDKEKANIENVVEVPNIKKSEAYDRAKIWMAINLKSSDQQILSDDENKEILIGTGNLLLPDKMLVQEKIVNYKISIFFKDGRYKYNISELVYYYVVTSADQRTRIPHMLGLNEEYKSLYSKKNLKKNKLHLEIDEAFKKLTDDLNRAIVNIAPGKANDW